MSSHAELKQRQGRIVNIGSLGGLHPWATHGHYLNHYLRPVSSYGLHPPTGIQPATTGLAATGIQAATPTTMAAARKAGRSCPR